MTTMYVFKARKVFIYTGKALTQETFISEQQAVKFVRDKNNTKEHCVWTIRKVKAPTCNLCGKYYTGKKCNECNQGPLF